MTAGAEYEAVIRESGDRRVRLEHAVRFSGLYEVQGRQLVCVEPADKTEEGGYVWEIRGPDELTLVAQSPKIQGSNYLGSTLVRRPVTAGPVRGNVATKDLRFQKAVPASELKVELAPDARVARTPKGLLLPVKITNSSPQEIRTTLGQESKAGLWPPTCLYASARPEKEPKAENFVPVYEAGEHTSLAPPTSLPAGTSRDITLRLDWPETGPAHALPLPHAAGNYQVQLLLVFLAGGKQQYVTSQPATVELPAQEEARGKGGPTLPPVSAGSPPPAAPSGVAAGGGRAGEALQPEAQELRGTWTAESQLYPMGRATPKNLLQGQRLVLDGKDWTLYQGDEVVHKRTWTIDPSKQPKHLDVHFQREGNEVTAKCIYKLDGDTLTIAHPLGERIEAIDRPANFGPSEGGTKSYVVEVWKRKKE
jgi:uncharacterized protein (TIGR03067 family)